MRHNSTCIATDTTKYMNTEMHVTNVYVPKTKTRGADQSKRMCRLAFVVRKRRNKKFLVLRPNIKVSQPNHMLLALQKTENAYKMHVLTD